MAQPDPTQTVVPPDIDRTTGPVDAVLFEAFPDTRLTDMILHTTSAGTLVVTAPKRAGAVRLEGTDMGLTAEQVPEPPDEELEPVEHIEPAPASEQLFGLNDLTRGRGD